MGIIKGFTNLFIGEDDSDEVDFGQEFGSPKSSKGSSTKDGFFDDNDFSGSKSKSGARSKENDDPRPGASPHSAQGQAQQTDMRGSTL